MLAAKYHFLPKGMLKYVLMGLLTLWCADSFDRSVQRKSSGYFQSKLMERSKLSSYELEKIGSTCKSLSGVDLLSTQWIKRWNIDLVKGDQTCLVSTSIAETTSNFKFLATSLINVQADLPAPIYSYRNTFFVPRIFLVLLIVVLTLFVYFFSFSNWVLKGGALVFVFYTALVRDEYFVEILGEALRHFVQEPTNVAVCILAFWLMLVRDRIRVKDPTRKSVCEPWSPSLLAAIHPALTTLWLSYSDYSFKNPSRHPVLLKRLISWTLRVQMIAIIFSMLVFEARHLGEWRFFEQSFGWFILFLGIPILVLGARRIWNVHTRTQWTLLLRPLGIYFVLFSLPAVGYSLIDSWLMRFSFSALIAEISYPQTREKWRTHLEFRRKCLGEGLQIFSLIFSMQLVGWSIVYSGLFEFLSFILKTEVGPGEMQWLLQGIVTGVCINTMAVPVSVLSSFQNDLKPGSFVVLLNGYWLGNLLSPWSIHNYWLARGFGLSLHKIVRERLRWIFAPALAAVLMHMTSSFVLLSGLRFILFGYFVLIAILIFEWRKPTGISGAGSWVR